MDAQNQKVFSRLFILVTPIALLLLASNYFYYPLSYNTVSDELIPFFNVKKYSPLHRFASAWGRYHGFYRPLQVILFYPPVIRSKEAVVNQ